MKFDVNIRHSVVIVSFNQQESIVKAISSILEQTVLPYELIILDDYSSDQTVEVAKEYLSQHEKLINYRVVVNNHNLGIPGNTLKIARVVKGNVVSTLAGDDYYQKNAIECINDAIIYNKLNPDSDIFVCFSPILDVNTSDNSSRYIPFKVVAKSPLKSMLHKTAPFAKVGFSVTSLLSAEYPDNLGIWADWVWDISICSRKVKYYEINYPCYVHISGVGISSKTNLKAIDRSYQQATQYILEKYHNSLNFWDKIYLLGELFYLKWKGSKNNIFYYLISISFFLLNIFQMKSIIEFKSALSRYLPIKKIKFFFLF